MLVAWEDFLDPTCRIREMGLKLCLPELCVQAFAWFSCEFWKATIPRMMS